VASAAERAIAAALLVAVMPLIAFLLPSTVFSQDHAPGSIMWHVNRAKGRHESTVQIPPPKVLYAEVENIRSASKRCAIVIADILDEITTYDTYQIYTLSKCKLHEQLNNYSLMRDDNPEEMIPREFLPLGPDEFVLVEPRGTIRIRDVTLSMSESGLLALPRSESRLLFVQFYARRRVAELVFGYQGVFSIKSDGTLRAAFDSADNEIKAELDKSYGSRVTNLRNELRSH
jgi:hypothetical protein